MQRLVCLGEILIDFLPIETAGEVTGFSMHPGGGPFNVAVGLARLGRPTAFVSKVGADFFGAGCGGPCSARGSMIAGC